MFEDDLRGDLYKEMASRADPVFVLNIIEDPKTNGFWCDNVLTATPESCEETLQGTLDLALDDLSERLGKDMTQWQWQKLHITRDLSRTAPSAKSARSNGSFTAPLPTAAIATPSMLHPYA